MIKKKLLGLIVALFMVPGVCMGLTITDTSSGLNSGTYTLDIISVVDGYRATFTADTNNVTGWSFAAFQIKFDGGAAGITYQINSAPSATWSWANNTSPIPLPNFGGTFPIDSYSLIYDTINTGVSLNSSSYIWEFDFTLAGPLSPQALQVLFYDGYAGGSSNVKTTRLSQSWTVPEPTTLLLLGSGLVALCLVSRKFKR
jgi:hypothetical protein